MLTDHRRDHDRNVWVKEWQGHFYFKETSNQKTKRSDQHTNTRTVKRSTYKRTNWLTNISPRTRHETMNDWVESNTLDSLSQPNTQMTPYITYHWAWSVIHRHTQTHTHSVSNWWSGCTANTIVHSQAKQELGGANLGLKSQKSRPKANSKGGVCGERAASPLPTS